MTGECGGFAHIALFYRGDRDYLDAVVPFLRDGVSNGDAVLAAVPPDKIGLLRTALGGAADQVPLVDMAAVGGNPARTFPMLSELCDRHPGGTRIVAEPVYPGRPAEAYPACVQNEALFNTAFAHRSLTTLCPYDATRLDDRVLADARTTHPMIQQGPHLLNSTVFAAHEALERYNVPLPVDPDAVTVTLRSFAELSDARALVAHYAEAAGLPAEAVGDLQLIATELATNSLEYAGGTCTLALWQRDGSLICQVDDAGRLEDPLAGRYVPDAHATGGRGLFLVNALADLVRTHTCADGTAIRAYMSLNRRPEGAG